MRHHEHDPETLAHLMAETAAIEAAIAASVDDALLMHKRIGNPIAFWQDGQVVWIPADQIPVDDTRAAQ
jgi:hypothetical protein